MIIAKKTRTPRTKQNEREASSLALTVRLMAITWVTGKTYSRVIA